MDTQAHLLTRAGCKKVLRDLASGAWTDRTQFSDGLDPLTIGEVAVVVLRLGQMVRDLLKLALIADEDARFRSPILFVCDRFRERLHHLLFLPARDTQGEKACT